MSSAPKDLAEFVSQERTEYISNEEILGLTCPISIISNKAKRTSISAGRNRGSAEKTN